MAIKPFEPVRLGVIGAGAFGRLHARTIGGLVEGELVAVVDRDLERAREVAAEAGGVPVWAQAEAALAAAGAQGWIIAAATGAHVELAKKGLEAGASVLVEKPLAGSLAEARDLAAAVARGPGRLMVGHVGLFNSEFEQLWIEAQQRGGVRLIDAVRHRPAALRARFAGESLFELLMVHDLVAVQALTGGREPAALEGWADGAMAGATLRWADGLTARLAASMLTPAGMAGDGFDRMEVFGAGWCARIEPNPRPMALWEDRARWPLELEIGPGARGMLAEELRCFCRVVRGARPPAGTGYEEAMQVQGWMERLKNYEL